MTGHHRSIEQVPKRSQLIRFYPIRGVRDYAECVRKQIMKRAALIQW